MTLLFRDASDNALGIITAEFAGYDPSSSELWFSTESGVCVTFSGVSELYADFALRALAKGFLDLSSTSFLGEVDYGE